jgi:hypothetical protein
MYTDDDDKGPIIDMKRDKDLIEWLEFDVHKIANANQTPLSDESFKELDQLAKEIWVLPATASATNSRCDGMKNRRKKFSKNEVSEMLKTWMNSINCPYPSTTAKDAMANLIGIPRTQVDTFCNNYRKRYSDVQLKLISFKKKAVVK